METIVTKAALYQTADISKNLTDAQINAAAVAAWSSIYSRIKHVIEDKLVYIGNEYIKKYYPGTNNSDYCYLYVDGVEFEETFEADRSIIAAGQKAYKEQLDKLLLAACFRTVSVLALIAGTVITQQGTLKTRRESYQDVEDKTLATFCELFNRLSDDALDAIIDEEDANTIQKRRGTTFKTYGRWKTQNF
jgi:hypothetical protein